MRFRCKDNEVVEVDIEEFEAFKNSKDVAKLVKQAQEEKENESPEIHLPGLTAEALRKAVKWATFYNTHTYNGFGDVATEAKDEGIWRKTFYNVDEELMNEMLYASEILGLEVFFLDWLFTIRGQFGPDKSKEFFKRLEFLQREKFTACDFRVDFD